jgi:hypothetical protein
MIDLGVGVVLLAVNGARGDGPDSSGGVLIIVGIALAVLLAGLLLVTIFRRGRSRRAAMTRTPDHDGHVGRVREFRDRA